MSVADEPGTPEVERSGRRLRPSGRRSAEPAPPRAPVPRWLQSGAAISWRFLAVAAAVVAVLYLLAALRVVVLPIIIALLVTTLLHPPVAWMRRRGMPAAAATAVVMLGAVLIIGGILAAIVPAIASQADDFGQGVQDGVREVGDLLAQPPFNLSAQDLQDRLDAGIGQARSNSGTLTASLQSGAVLLGELITGLFIVLLLTFFFLKDGDRMWDWLLELAAHDRRPAWNEVGGRVFTALGGYVRGIALVGLVDALLIGIALIVIGVPLVLPLMVLTFLGAFFPLIGAFTAGLAAVLIALVSNGVGAALLVLGAIILVQQVEGHLLYPLLMGRTVHLHPVVIIVALASGGILAGIIGVFLAVPAAGVASVVLDYSRHHRPSESPEPPTASDGAAPGPGATVAG